MKKIGLYLAGGGARGAYQAGVLKAISHILNVKKIPFETITGVSVGCLNAAIIGQYADNFVLGAERLEEIWSEIHCYKIFNASNYQLSKSVFRNLANVLVRSSQAGYLLDTSPLHQFITDSINFKAITRNINQGLFKTMEIISNCYENHQTVSFCQHHLPEFNSWVHPRHISQQVQLSKEHILASSALPLFFPPAKIDGVNYGDGSMGLIAPLRGSIRFQVDKILILGTRQPASLTTTDTEVSNERPIHQNDIGFARILGSMLNGLFLDNLDHDIDMVNRMNDIAGLLSLWKKRRSPWRPIQTMHLRPSVDMASIAQSHYNVMPALLRFMLNLLGARSHSGDLVSFLLFEKEFTQELLRLGYSDTMSAEESILEFFDA